jgi:molybdate transport system permease protein
MLSAEEWSALLISLRVAAWSAAAMLIPGIACAWLLARRRFIGKTLLDALIHLPLVLPPVVVGYGLLMLLGRNGIVGRWLDQSLGIQLAFTWRAAAIASALMGFPLLVRTTRLAIEAVDLRLEDAARTLGSSPARVFCTITLPLALPGVLAGLVLAFARGLGEFGATIIFAGNIEGATRTLPLAVYTYSQSPGGDAAALRLIAISVTVSLAALVASELLARRLSQRRGAEARSA